jgi:hypothetical protein
MNSLLSWDLLRVIQTNLGVLMNLQFPILRGQQVVDLFIKNFHAGYPQKKLTIHRLKW